MAWPTASTPAGGRKASESCVIRACISDPLIEDSLLLNAGSRHDGREDSGGPRTGADCLLAVYAALLAACKLPWRAFSP